MATHSQLLLKSGTSDGVVSLLSWAKWSQCSAIPGFDLTATLLMSLTALLHSPSTTMVDGERTWLGFGKMRCGGLN